MADREMVAATLAAALLSGRDFSGPRSDPGGYAVQVYHQVLAALDAAEPLMPQQRANRPPAP